MASPPSSRPVSTGSPPVGDIVEVGDQSGGWGKLELPADGNPRDNVTYYRYSDDHPPGRAGHHRGALGPLGEAAASVADTSSRKPAKRLAPDDFTSSDLRDITLVVGRRHCRKATPPPRSGSSSTRAVA